MSLGYFQALQSLAGPRVPEPEQKNTLQTQVDELPRRALPAASRPPPAPKSLSKPQAKKTIDAAVRAPLRPSTVPRAASASDGIDYDAVVGSNPISHLGNKHYTVSQDALLTARGARILEADSVPLKYLQQAAKGEDAARELVAKKRHQALQAQASARAMRRDRGAVERYLKSVVSNADATDPVAMNKQATDEAGLEPVRATGSQPPSAANDDSFFL